jgi:hypothetical protein
LEDVTHLLNSYRECARGLWNNFLRQGADFDRFDRIDAFSAICAHLFDEIVLRPLGKLGHGRQTPNDLYVFLNVVPTVDPVPIMINRPSDDGNKYWDEPITRVSPQQVKLLFIDYFDWGQMGFVDFEYYRVKVISLDSHPDLVGREALLAVHDGKVVMQS